MGASVLPLWSLAATWQPAPADFAGGRFARFGPFETVTRTVARGDIQIALASGNIPASKDEILHWIDQAADAVTAYYGQFPVTHVDLVILREGNNRVHAGSEHEGEWILIKLGRDTHAADLDDDWQLTHEFFHLGFPQVPRRYHWMEEGLSTYLEPNARARAGNLTPERFWIDLVEGLPQGQPQAGDRGLDRTPTWGRTYWGGALFWFVVDVEIRERSNNRHSLDDSIRAILNQGGNGAADWSLDEVLRAGDAATGLPVLKETHERLGDHPAAVDLAELWRKLGVIYRNGTVTFDDTAPLAAIRTAITAPTSNPPAQPRVK